MKKKLDFYFIIYFSLLVCYEREREREREVEFDNSFLSCYREFWKNYVKLEGRATRKEFWFACLANLLISCLIGITQIINLKLYQFFNLLFIIITFVPNITVGVRRFHDIGKSGFQLLFYCIMSFVLLIFFAISSIWKNDYYGLFFIFLDIIVFIVLTVFLCKQGENNINKYGKPRIYIQRNHKTNVYLDELQKLFDLKQKGAITEEEYIIEKDKLKNS